MIVEKYLTTKQIKGFLYKYIPKNKEEKKGLFLLPSQTGSGKTHATIQYISERISDSHMDYYNVYQYQLLVRFLYHLKMF